MYVLLPRTGYGKFDYNAYPGTRIASISPENPIAANLTRHPKLGCGACFEIQCIGSTCAPNGGEINPLVVMVADTCPKCNPNQLVIPYGIFNVTLANSPNVNTAAVRYRQVECDTRGKPIVIDVDIFRPKEEGGGYIRLALESITGSNALRSVELRKSGGGGVGGGGGEGAPGPWLPMNNTYGAKWELSNVPDIPMDMRITSDNGTALVQVEAINEQRIYGFATFVQFTL
jgi:Expansin C-terminal domain